MKLPFPSTDPAFSAIPWLLMDAYRDASVLGVYAVLYRHGWGSPGGCWASVQTLSQETGVGVHRLRRILAQLNADGWIETVERPGSSSVHRVHLAPAMEASDAEPPGRQLKGSRPPKTQATPSKTVRPPLPESTGHPFRNQQATPSTNGRGVLTESVGDPLRIRQATPSGIDRGALTELIGDPLQNRKTNKNPLTRTQEQEPKNNNPPLTPHPGGDGLPAVDRSTGEGRVVDVAVVEQPAQPTAEQPSAIVPVDPKRPRAKPTGGLPSPEDARRLMAIWNKHKPPGWSGLNCVNDRRWEVAQAFARDLGGLEAFLAALPIALHNAGQDRFWRAPGHDWNSFMGYGAKTGKGHFLRFLEQEAPRVPTVNRDGSLTLAGMALEPDLPHLF